MRLSALLAGTCLVLTHGIRVNGLRHLAAVPSMAPSMAEDQSSRPTADLKFILTADKAVFKTETMVKLAGVSKAVPYFAGKRAGSMALGAFANSMPGSPLLSADGYWLDRPQALLYGANSAGNLSSVALEIHSVKYMNETGHVKFNMTVLAPATASLKLMDGPVGTAITDNQQGVGPMKLMPAVKANETWTAVTLVIESTRSALKQQAETKTLCLLFGCGYGGYGNGYGYNNGYYNNGYNNGYYNNGWGNGWNWGK